MARNVYIEFIECVGCEACVALCPEVFRMNESGDRAEVIVAEIADGSAMEECIEKAISICPADCIHWDE